LSIRIDNLVILGTAVPELRKDGHKTVCVAGWNKDLGFVRIYPCNAEMGLHRWDVVSVTVEGNNKDTRFESWKLIGEAPSIFKTGRIEGTDRKDLMEATVSLCVTDINNMKLSLGVIQAHHITTKLTKNSSLNNQETFSELENDNRWLKTRGDYLLQPKLEFNCGNACRSKNKHSQTVLEWGAYEWVRKNPENIHQLFNNWKINNPDYDIFFVVGNLCRHRNSFIIISVIPLKKSNNTNHLLFDFPQIATKNRQYTLQRRIGIAINKNNSDINTD